MPETHEIGVQNSDDEDSESGEQRIVSDKMVSPEPIPTSEKGLQIYYEAKERVLKTPRKSILKSYKQSSVASRSGSPETRSPLVSSKSLPRL